MLRRRLARELRELERELSVVCAVHALGQLVRAAGARRRLSPDPSAAVAAALPGLRRARAQRVAALLRGLPRPRTGAAHAC